MKKAPKTHGLTWLEHSLTAFNGSGYADRTNPEKYVDSYIIYKLWKRKPEAAELARQYYQVLLPLAEHFIATSEGAGKGFTPSARQHARFEAFKLHGIL